MDIPGSCLRDCFFANVRLPLELGTDGPGKVDPAHTARSATGSKRPEAVRVAFTSRRNSIGTSGGGVSVAWFTST